MTGQKQSLRAAQKNFVTFIIAVKTASRQCRASTLSVKEACRPGIRVAQPSMSGIKPQEVFVGILDGYAPRRQRESVIKSGKWREHAASLVAV